MNPSVLISVFNGARADMDEIAAFHLGVRRWQEETQNNIFSDILDSQADLTHIYDYYLVGSGGFFVARVADTNRVVGIVGLKDNDNSTGSLKRLAVDPKYHHQKIATRLVDQLIEWAINHKFNKITLQTGQRENAKPLYEKAGFKVTGRMEHNNDYVMELDLTRR